MSKKLTALLLALALALSLAAPCNAANKAKAPVPQSYTTEWDEDADKMSDGIYIRHNSYQVTKNLFLRATPSWCSNNPDYRKPMPKKVKPCVPHPYYARPSKT